MIVEKKWRKRIFLSPDTHGFIYSIIFKEAL
jgi:hypothetical protein